MTHAKVEAVKIKRLATYAHANAVSCWNLFTSEPSLKIPVNGNFFKVPKDEQSIGQQFALAVRLLLSSSSIPCLIPDKSKIHGFSVDGTVVEGHEGSLARILLNCRETSASFLLVTFQATKRNDNYFAWRIEPYSQLLDEPEVDGEPAGVKADGDSSKEVIHTGFGTLHYNPGSNRLSFTDLDGGRFSFSDSTLMFHNRSGEELRFREDVPEAFFSAVLEADGLPGNVTEIFMVSMDNLPHRFVGISPIITPHGPITFNSDGIISFDDGRKTCVYDPLECSFTISGRKVLYRQDVPQSFLFAIGCPMPRIMNSEAMARQFRTDFEALGLRPEKPAREKANAHLHEHSERRISNPEWEIEFFPEQNKVLFELRGNDTAPGHTCEYLNGLRQFSLDGHRPLRFSELPHQFYAALLELRQNLPRHVKDGLKESLYGLIHMKKTEIGEDPLAWAERKTRYL